MCWCSINHTRIFYFVRISQKDDPPFQATHLCRLPSPDDPPLSFALKAMKHSLQSARGKTAYKSTATAGLEAELQVQDLKRRCKGGGGKETGVGLGESSQGLQRREVTMQATGGEERVL